MKVVHVTLSLTGGAGIACRRLHAALREAGIDSRIRTAIGEPAPGVTLWQKREWLWRARLDRLPTARYRHRRIFAWWSNNWLPSSLLRSVVRERPDVIHLHWIGDGWVSPHEIAGCPIPIVWTMHDTWAATGGCHYPAACGRFSNACGACPQLGSTNGDDLSARNFRRKAAAWRGGRLAIVSPSGWMDRLAARGATRDCRHEVIANGVDHRRFSPGDRQAARARLGLADHETAVLVFSSGDLSDERKGTALAAAAIESARREAGDVRVIVAGGGWLPGIGGAAVSAGRITAESELVSLFNAADALVLPSLQDNLPNTAVEAMACGCPVLAFAVGGIADVVITGRSGMLAPAPSEAALAGLLREFMRASGEQHLALRAGARAVFLERFRADERAADHVRLYQQLAATNR
jgi:glycosyltransferase involved in cell wall biosynthesis